MKLRIIEKCLYIISISIIILLVLYFHNRYLDTVDWYQICVIFWVIIIPTLFYFLLYPLPFYALHKFSFFSFPFIFLVFMYIYFHKETIDYGLFMQYQFFINFFSFFRIILIYYKYIKIIVLILKYEILYWKIFFISIIIWNLYLYYFKFRTILNNLMQLIDILNLYSFYKLILYA